jgi:twinkle protein
MAYEKTHQPCSECGSSNALVINEDGSTKCFSCTTYHPASDELVVEKLLDNIPMRADLLSRGDIVAIADRNISKETCDVYDVTVSPNGYKHYYPYCNEDGEWIANKIRMTDPEGGKSFKTVGDWSDVVLFGQNTCRKEGKYITLCEGELDALAAYEMMGSKWPVVSIKNGAGSAVKDIENSFEFLMGYENIILCFDNDRPGKEASKKIAELLAPKAKVMKLKLKDANDYLIANKTDDFINCWWSAERYTPDGIIAGTDLWDKLKEGPAKTAVNYPYEGMNKMTYGIRMGELITVCAGTGIGKSSFLREIIEHIYKNTDDNIGMMFMEESVRNTAEAMMSLELGKQLHLPTTEYTNEEYERAYKDTVGSGRYFFFDHFGSNSIDNILSRIRYFAKAVKCKYIVLDHISILVSSQEHSFDERRTIDECMTKLRTVVQELNICLITVSHLRRPSNGQSHEEGLNTSLSDLRGSASIGQLSDIVIGLERNGQADDLLERHTTYIRIIKNRFSGLTGLSAKLFYDFEDGRMRERDLELTEEGDSDEKDL